MHWTFQLFRADYGRAVCRRVLKSKTRGRLQLFSIGMLLLWSPALGPAGAADVNTIVSRWTEANRRDFEAAPQYRYLERIRDDDGTKTYEVTMLFGRPFKRLVEQDDKALTDERRRHQEEAFEQARREREAESPDQRQQRIAEYQKSREGARRVLEEIPRAFEFRLRSTRAMNAATVYILSAVPRAGYDAPNAEAEVLTGMQGEFWIDTATYQLVHGWARVSHPVTIEGFLATVQPGTEFEVDQRPVDDGIWLPAHFAIHSRSSIIFLFHHRISEDRTYFNYRKISESRLQPSHPTYIDVLADKPLLPEILRDDARDIARQARW
jgi:hypothetical protein